MTAEPPPVTDLPLPGDWPRKKLLLWSIAGQAVLLPVAAHRYYWGGDWAQLIHVACAVLLVVCDTLARTITPLGQLPTGAVTAVLGGPFFIVILVQGKRAAAMWGRA